MRESGPLVRVAMNGSLETSDDCASAARVLGHLRPARAVARHACDFFTSAGLLAGPVFGLVDLSIGSEPVKLLAEATLTLVLFADASRHSRTLAQTTATSDRRVNSSFRDDARAMAWL